MQKYFFILLAAGLLTGCAEKDDSTSKPSSEEKVSSDTTEKSSAEQNIQKTHEEDIHDREDATYKDTENLKPGVKKTYPLTKLTTKTIDKMVRVNDNDTVLYTEDTGHGIPTKPAGEGQEIHAILEVKLDNMTMYMLDNGSFITANPQYVEVIKKSDNMNKYPVFKMHEDDEKYLKSLNQHDSKYQDYVKYVHFFGERQYDYMRELLMHTAIHAVNHATPGSLAIPKEYFKPFDVFKDEK